MSEKMEKRPPAKVTAILEQLGADWTPEELHELSEGILGLSRDKRKVRDTERGDAGNK
jgi:hypothetical protein